jgi:hypothetical protein
MAPIQWYRESSGETRSANLNCSAERARHAPARPASGAILGTGSNWLPSVVEQGVNIGDQSILTLQSVGNLLLEADLVGEGR